MAERQITWEPAQGDVYNKPDTTYAPELRPDVLQEGFVQGYEPGSVVEGAKIPYETRDIQWEPEGAPAIPTPGRRQVRRQQRRQPTIQTLEGPKPVSKLGTTQTSRFNPAPQLNLPPVQSIDQIMEGQRRAQLARVKQPLQVRDQIADVTRRNPDLKVMRASTPQEAHEADWLEQEQGYLNKVGQAPYALRQGAGEFINTISSQAEGVSRFVDDYIRDHGVYDVNVFRDMANSMEADRKEWDRIQGSLEYGDRRSIGSRVIPAGVSIAAQIALLKKFPSLGNNPSAVMGLQKMLAARANGIQDAKTLAAEGLTGAAQGYAMSKANALQNPLTRVAAGAAGSAAPPVAERALLGRPQDPGQTAEEALMGGLFALPGGAGPIEKAPLPGEVAPAQGRIPLERQLREAPVEGGIATPSPEINPPGAPSEGVPGQLRPSSPALLARQRLMLEPTPIEKALGPSPFAGQPPMQFPLTEAIMARRGSKQEALRNTDPMTGLPLYTGSKNPLDTSYEAWQASQQIAPGTQPRIADDPYLQEIQPLQQSALAKMGLENSPEQALNIVNNYRESIEQPRQWKTKEYQQAWQAMSTLTPQELGAMGEFGLQMRDPQFPSQLQQKYQGPGLEDLQVSPGPKMDSPQGPLDVQIYRAKGSSLNIAGSEYQRPGSFNKEFGATHYPAATDLRLPGPASNIDEIAVSWPAGGETLYENQLHHGTIPNSLFELRVEDRPMVGGGKGMMGVELQSSWAQDKVKKSTNPIRNQWLNRALDFMIQEAQSRGVDGILMPNTPEQIYQIQKYGPVKTDAEGLYRNNDGTNVSPIIKRYTKEIPEMLAKISKKTGIPLQQREIVIDEDTGETTSMLFLPIPKEMDLSIQVKQALGLDTPYPQGWGPETTEPIDKLRQTDEYQLAPPATPTEAPMLQIPAALWDRAFPAGAGGARISISRDLDNILSYIESGTLTPSEKAEMQSQLQDAAAVAEMRGLDSFGVASTAHSGEELTRHETFHVGQGKVLPPGTYNLHELHDPQWAASHPTLIKAVTSARGQQITTKQFPLSKIPPIQRMAYELPAYINQGSPKGDEFGLTSAERIDYMMDYRDHLREKWGPASADILQEVSRLRPGIKELFDITGGESYVQGRIGGGIGEDVGSGNYPARGVGPTWADRRRGSAPLPNYEAVASSASGERQGLGLESQLGSRVATAERGGSRAGELESNESRPDMALMAPSREQNARAFVAQADPRLRLPDGSPRPVYHGTQSPSEITRIDPSKFDPNALYGPGFYTTQDPRVAAGEGGYVDTKPATPPTSDQAKRLPEYPQAYEEAYRELKAEWEEGLGPLNESEDRRVKTLAEGKAVRLLQERAIEGAPAGYKLYLNIKKPFDVDAPADPGIAAKVANITNDSLIKLAVESKNSDLITNDIMYHELVKTLGSKRAVNDWLKKEGYDGITHIGGQNADAKHFDYEQDAIAYAEQTGGEITPDPQGRSYGDWFVQGHRVWIAFDPTQVKSATGNMGSFEGQDLSVTNPALFEDLMVNPINPDLERLNYLLDQDPSLSEPIKKYIRDIARNPGSITNAQLAQLRNYLKPDIMSALNDLKAGAPPPSKGTPPPRQGGLSDDDVLYTNQVRNPINKELALAFIQALQTGGITYNPTVPPFLQVTKAMMEGKLRPGDVDYILKSNNKTWDDFAQDYEATASDAGRTLSYLSWIQGRWSDLEKVNPELAKRLKPALGRARSVMRDIDNTILGRNMWERSGGLLQKMALTQLSTTAVNTLTTIGQLPLFASYQGLGAWMQTMAEGKGSLVENLKQANKDAVDSMAASFEVIRSLNPRQLAQMLKGRPPTEYTRNMETVQQLAKSFPELHRKLEKLSYGQETLQEGADQLKVLKDIIPQIKDDTERKEIIKKVAKYETRLNSNLKGIGRVMGTGELVYDTLLKPMSWSEYALKRPMFVGQLRLELQNQGVDLDQVLASGKFSDIDYETMQTAVNRASEFVYSYQPSEKGPGMEPAAAAIIQGLNSLGPISFFAGAGFARASYNGMKFLYEWGPWGMMTPGQGGSNIYKFFRQQTVQDPVTGEPVRVNAPTRKDWGRLAKAMLGTLAYSIAWGMLDEFGGPEWYLFDFSLGMGKKDKDGRPIYSDIRKMKPFSEIVRIADLAKRAHEGRLGDIDIGKQMTEALTGLRTVEGQPEVTDWYDAIKSTYEYWGGSGEDLENPMMMKAKEMGGRGIALPFTPLVNARDLYVQFKESENVKLETRGQGWMGPTLDKLPWVRTHGIPGTSIQGLPPLTSPAEPSPIGIADQPGWAQFGGWKEVVGENFAGREWRRLGLANKTFLPRDPDPLINRAQNELFQEVINELGNDFSKDPSYMRANDSEKAGMWEAIVGGDKGIKARVQEYAESANPLEKAARDAQRRMPGKLQRKAYGLDDTLKEIRRGQ